MVFWSLWAGKNFYLSYARGYFGLFGQVKAFILVMLEGMKGKAFYLLNATRHFGLLV